MKQILFLLGLSSATQLIAQNAEVQIFQKTATSTTAQVGIRARAKVGTIDYIGLTMYLMYQSANAAPQTTVLNSGTGVDDSKLVTTFMWGTSTRFINPAQVINPPFIPLVISPQSYNRRYVYGNSDEATPANTKTLTTSWDTLFFITLNTLQSTYPQGGYAYLQKTTEALGASLTDPFFANIPIDVTSGQVPLGIGAVLPVLITKLEATCNTNGALVSWSTASELNSDYFEIQRSVNGFDWIGFSIVKAAGTSGVGKTYQQLDLSGGNALYRIKQVDVDGHFIYTNVVKTNCERRNIDVAIYPVPAHDVLNVVIRSDRSLKTQLNIYDGVGKLIKKVDVVIANGNNNFNINLKGLAGGEYIIRNSDTNLTINKRFTIVR